MAPYTKRYPKGHQLGGKFMPKVGGVADKLNPLASLAKKRRASELRRRTAGGFPGSGRPTRHDLETTKRHGPPKSAAELRAARAEYDRRKKLSPAERAAENRQAAAERAKASVVVVRPNVDADIERVFEQPKKRGGPKKGAAEQTRKQSETMRREIDRLGAPMREETLPGGARKLSWKIGQRTITKVVQPDGSIGDKPSAPSPDVVEIDTPQGLMHLAQGRGKRSKGHVEFIGRWEYLTGPDGDLYRAPRDNPLDVGTGYRTGARFESRSHASEAILKRAREHEAKNIRVELNPDVFSLIKERGLDSPEQPKGNVAQRVLGDAKDTRELHSTEVNGQRVYTAERKKLHDQIVASVLKDAKKPAGKPKMLFMGGGSGSGKSTTKERLAEEGVIPEGAVDIDPDAIKEQLPEFAEMAAAKDPYSAFGSHEESSDISKRIQEEAQQAGLNIILDGTGNAGPGKFKGKLEEAADKGYDVEVVVVNAPTATSIERAIGRAERTGRYVPIPAIRQIHKSVSQAFEEWSPSGKVKSWRVYDNGSAAGPPVLVAQGGGGEGGTQVHDPKAYAEFLAKGEESLEAKLEALKVSEEDLRRAREALGVVGRQKKIPIKPRDAEAALRAGRRRRAGRREIARALAEDPGDSGAVPVPEWIQWIPADPASWDDLPVRYEGDADEKEMAEFTYEDALEYAEIVYAAVPNFQLVGARARGKLAPLMAHYGKMAHPFTACVADNTKRFGPERAKRVCAVLKDLIRGTTKWRSTERAKAYSDFQAVVAFSDEVDEQALDDFARWLDDADVSRLL